MRSSSARAPEIEEGILRVEGVPLRYQRAGSGPAVALIHGASSNLRDMSLDLLPRLAANHTVVALDRPGHGGSGWPARGGEQLDTQARLMRGALETLGIPRAVVLGHSYGGAVALAWGLRFPASLSGLVLIGAPSQGWIGGMGLANDLLANPMTGPAFAWLLPMLVGPTTLQRHVDELFAPQRPPGGMLRGLGLGEILAPETLRANAVQLLTLRRQLLEMKPWYRDLAMPVEIVHGEADTVVDCAFHARPLAAQVPGARLTILPGVGHMAHHSAPEAVEAAVTRVVAGG